MIILVVTGILGGVWTPNSYLDPIFAKHFASPTSRDANSPTRQPEPLGGLRRSTRWPSDAGGSWGADGVRVGWVGLRDLGVDSPNFLTYISCIVRDNPPPKIVLQGSGFLHFRYLKFLVIDVFFCAPR